jgi:hypothetical protein
MIELANLLIGESIQPDDPISPPTRTLAKDEFFPLYQEHSKMLCDLLDEPNQEEPPPVDEELIEARGQLHASLDVLQQKLEKLNTIRFWMGNMIGSRPPVETPE